VLGERLPEWKPKITSGSLTPLSLQPQSQSVGSFTFGHVIFDIPRTDFRLLAGAAGGSRNLFGDDAASFLGGLEFPITDHLAFTGEWFSGNHDFGDRSPASPTIARI
jgi:hypothetical protein